MSRWAVIFDNDVSNPALKDQSHRDAQHAYLRENEAIRLAGATATDAGQPFTGGMWMVDAPDRRAVIEMVEACPFFRSGVHRRYQVLWWIEAIGTEGRVIIDA